SFKNTFCRILYFSTIVFLLQACYRENDPPGCETIKAPYMKDSVLDFIEDDRIEIRLPSRPNSLTELKVITPDGFLLNNVFEIHKQYATQEEAGLYKMYYQRGYCKSPESEFSVNVISNSSMCKLSDNRVRFWQLGEVFTYDRFYNGTDTTGYGKYNLVAKGDTSGCTFIFGTNGEPTANRSYTPIIRANPASDEVIIRIQMGSENYYASGENGKLLLKKENEKLILTFCELKFLSPTGPDLTGSGRIVIP
ncbi:MAG: hypothetical protein ACXWEY_11455, partial [Bacteroidia bacterium]